MPISLNMQIQTILNNCLANQETISIAKPLKNVDVLTILRHRPPLIQHILKFENRSNQISLVDAKLRTD